MTRPASPPSRSAASSACGRRASSASSRASSRIKASTAPPASATRDGRRMAFRTRPMRIRTSPAMSPSSTTASSRISGSSRRNSRRRALPSPPRPTPRWSPILSTGRWRWGCRRARPCSRRSSDSQGAFALAMMFTGEDDLMIGARRGPPLAVGHGEGACISAPMRSRSRRSPTASPISKTATGRC